MTSSRIIKNYRELNIIIDIFNQPFCSRFSPWRVQVRVAKFSIFSTRSGRPITVSVSLKISSFVGVRSSNLWSSSRYCKAFISSHLADATYPLKTNLICWRSPSVNSFAISSRKTVKFHPTSSAIAGLDMDVLRLSLLLGDRHSREQNDEFRQYCRIS